ncbi:MAG TPA: cytochrome c biogenesis protein ResB [Bacilli bacterium]
MVFENTKCECGHQNPAGTVLCESCGKPLQEHAGQKLLEMRYDGVARRSQKANPNIIDRIWNFFSSVRNAVIIIVITLVGASLGTVYPQENTFIHFDPSVYYKETYGTLGEIYYLLGLSHTYTSWWFKTLLVMLGASLVICSLDRVVPLYRALNKQKIRKHREFIQRQRVTYMGPIPAGVSDRAWVEKFAEILRKKRFRVRMDGSALLAEKNRFSRWGPYINHCGLIIFLLAVLLRGVPGWYMDEYVNVLEGDTVPIPGTPYFVQNKQFTAEYYSAAELPEKFRDEQRYVPKLFRTEAVLYKCTANCGDPAKKPVLTKVKEGDIEVNHPLSYKGMKLYQIDFSQTPQIVSIDTFLTDQTTGKSYGPFTLSMKNPQESYDVGPYHLELKSYFPDFAINEQKKPYTKSNNPNAPAFVFLVTGPGIAQTGEIYIYFPLPQDQERFSQDKLNGDFGKKIAIDAKSMDDVRIALYTSLLNAHVERAIPYIFSGAIIFIIGVAMGVYWQHRRVWLTVEDGALLLGAHTNKNWIGLRREVAAMLGKSGIAVKPKQLENGGEQR